MEVVEKREREKKKFEAGSNLEGEKWMANISYTTYKIESWCYLGTSAAGTASCIKDGDKTKDFLNIQLLKTKKKNKKKSKTRQNATNTENNSCRSSTS